MSLLSQRFPDIHIEQVLPSTTAGGLYEVVTDRELVYADKSGEHLFVGYIVDTATRQNLTAQHWNEIIKADFNALPFDQAIKIVRGNGSRRLALFEDPLCPFCQKLEQDTQGVTDVTIYTFLFPLEQLHPGATARARQIWCAPDRAAAWSQWMRSQTPAQDQAECKGDPIAANLVLAQKLRVNATPTLIFADGSRVTTAISAAELESHLGPDSHTVASSLTTATR
jgi:thiol:disulfide interchange protein DsbC